MDAADEEALDGAAFARLIEPLGPFESRPAVAAAVSGGPDSLALALLAAPWVARRGGTLTALVVDHGLNDVAAAAAKRAMAWLSERGIASVGLRWEGSKPKTGVQAAAREARYRLLGDWCAANGVLHLLTAHHRTDQAETVLLRLAAGSGFDGLAAMPAVQDTRWGRILRPFLRVDPTRLRAMLASLGQVWIEDPANDDPVFARTRLRRSAIVLAREGLTPARLAQTAGRIAAAREVLESETAALLARCVTVYPAGYALVDRGALAAAPSDLSRRALERILGCIGGRGRPPRHVRLAPLLHALRSDGVMEPRTLGGCAVRPAGHVILFVREAGAIRDRVPVVPNGETLWDGRFRVFFSGGAERGGRTHLRALGDAGWRDVRDRLDNPSSVPDRARRALPAVYDDGGVLEVPHLDYRRNRETDGEPVIARLAFAPARPLAATEFAVV